MTKITPNEINEIDKVIDENTAPKYYIIEDVKTSGFGENIEEAFTLREIESDKDAKVDDVFIIKTQNGNRISYLLCVMLRDGVMVYDNHGTITGKYTVYDLRFLIAAQRLFIKHHTAPVDTKKKVIFLEGYGNQINPLLPASNKLKSRFIIERKFDIDEKYEIGKGYTTSCLLGYFSDNINISVYRNNRGQYRLKIDRTDKQHQEEHLEKAYDIEFIPSEGLAQACIGCQTLATFNCYTQAKDALINIVKEIDKCEVYGVLKRAHSYDCYTPYNNETLIRAFDLKKI